MTWLSRHPERSAPAAPAVPPRSPRHPGPPGPRARRCGRRSSCATVRAKTPDNGSLHRWSGPTPTAPPGAAETGFRSVTTHADRSRWETRHRSRPPAGPLASVSPAPPHCRRPGEIPGVRKASHHDPVAGLHLAVGYRTIEVDRDPGAEQVATLFKGVPMTFLGQLERFTPVAQKRPVGLVGDQQVDVFGGQADSVTDRQRHFRDLPVATGQHLGDLAFGEAYAALAEAGRPPLAGAGRRRASSHPRIRRRCGTRHREWATDRSK